MNKNTEIENKVDHALRSLEEIKRASPGVFFFTRVQARLRKAEISVWERITSFVARPAVAFTIICLIVLMNTLAVIQQKETSPAIADQPSDQSYYEEYNVASNSFYDVENNEP